LNFSVFLKKNLVSFLDKNRAEPKMFTPSNGKMVSASPRERGIDFFDFDVYKVELWDPGIKDKL